MSIWNHPDIQECTAGIERADFFRSESGAEIWGGIEKLRAQYLVEIGAHTGRMLNSPDGTRDAREISKLRSYEVKVAFVSALFGLTHENADVRRKAERGVRNVIEGRLPVMQGRTIGGQFFSAAQHAVPNAKKSNSEVTFGLN